MLFECCELAVLECCVSHRFELLIDTTTITPQPLLRPMPLDLSPAHEAIVLAHLPVFKANGFSFDTSDFAESATSSSDSKDSSSSSAKDRKSTRLNSSHT